MQKHRIDNSHRFEQLTSMRNNSLTSKSKHSTTFRILLSSISILNLLVTMTTVNAATRTQVNVKANPVSNLIHINSHQSSASQLLEELAQTLGIVMHYAVPEDLQISVDCEVTGLKEVMNCLFGEDLGLAVRYTAQGKPQEAWLIGFNGKGKSLVSAPRLPGVPFAQNDSNQELESQLTEARSKDIEVRSNALTNLVAAGNKDDPRIHSTLTEALRDANPKIRASAIKGLATLGNEAAGEELLQALHDSVDWVRLAVVDNAGNNSTLLQQALLDNNEQVRNIATSKLNALNRRAERGL